MTEARELRSVPDEVEAVDGAADESVGDVDGVAEMGVAVAAAADELVMERVGN